jgi:hypothetical protein
MFLNCFPSKLLNPFIHACLMKITLSEDGLERGSGPISREGREQNFETKPRERKLKNK